MTPFKGKKYNILTAFWCLCILICRPMGLLATPVGHAANPTIIVNLSTIEATCGKNDGTIKVTASNGTAPYQYSIDGVNFQASSTFSNVGPGHYTVSVTDAGGNTGSSGVTISNLAGPTISSTATTATCPNNDGSLTLSGVNGTMPYTYSTDGTNFQPGGSFIGLPSGTYTATIKDVNGCIDQQSAVVPLNNDLIVDAGRDTTICQGSSVTLGAVSNGSSFSWSPSAGLSDPSTLDPKASPVSSTTYTLTIKWGLCQQTAAVAVNINPAPIASAGADTSICYGKSVPLSGSGGGTYSWTPATYLDQPATADPNVNDPAITTTYSLVVTDINGCPSQNDAHTTVTVIPPPRLFAGSDTAVLVNQSLILHAVDVDNSGFTQYSWSPAAGLDDPSSQDPVAQMGGTSATYTVTSSTPNGCQAKASVTIKVFSAIDLFVPTAFTPNGDGHNDLLRVIAIGIKQFEYFAVFNRSGQRLFFTSDPGKGWDGTLNGQPQTAGIYVWMTGCVDSRGQRIEHRGTVMLIR